MKNIIIGSRM